MNESVTDGLRPAGEGPQEAHDRYRRLFASVPVSIWEEDWTEVIAMVRRVPAGSPEEFRSYLAEHPGFVREALRKVRILDVNEHTLEMFGATSKDDLLGSLEVVFSTDDTLPGFEGELVALFSGLTVYRTRMALRKVSGELIRTLLTMSFPPPESESGWVSVSLMDITDHERALEEVQHRNRDLETLLHISSHDLREPLRAIETFSRMVRDRYGERLDDKGRDFLDRVVRGARRMDRLLADLLQLSRAQRLRAEAIQPVAGTRIIQRALEGLQATIRQSGAVVEIAEDFPDMVADEVWAGRAVYNLVGNALKFHRPGEAPRVSIVPWEGPGEVGISVMDRGPGIPPDQRERVFQLFQRGVGQEIPGNGAGLAIARQVAERHGGRVFVQEREGGGCTFTITFKSPRRLRGEERQG